LLVKGSMCGEGEAKMNRSIDAYLEWIIDLSDRWSGLGFFAPIQKPGKCPDWELGFKYMFLGGHTDSLFISDVEKFTKSMNGIDIIASYNKTTANVWEKVLPHGYDVMTNGINPFKYAAGQGPGVTPSVLLSRETLAGDALRMQTKEQMLRCRTSSHNCQSLQFYNDIPGTRSSEVFPASSTSIHPDFRAAVAHVVVMTDSLSNIESWYELGAASYFSESAYIQTGDSWKDRTWGPQYAKLLAVKKRVDPENVFWCHHCVGSDLVGCE